MQAPDSIGTEDPGTGAPTPDAADVRFVLIEPSHCGNIGAAARAIRTMGFGCLSVVAPREPGYRESGEAVALAVGAVGVLKDSRSHATLVEALGGVSRAFAMPGYPREYGPPHQPLRESALQAGDWLRQ